MLTGVISHQSYKKKLTAMERAFASPSPRSSAIGRLIRERSVLYFNIRFS